MMERAGAGAIVGGFLINNNNTLAHNYTSAVPGTYLSVSAEKGLRICSNIDIDDFSYLEGSFQNSELYETTNAGKRWQGKILMDERNGYGIIVADPLYNIKNEVIGNIGVGAPTYLFADLGYGDLLFISIITLLLILIAAFVLRVLCGRITAPPAYPAEILTLDCQRRHHPRKISPGITGLFQ